MRKAYLKQHNGNSITGTKVMASSPLYLIATHCLLRRAPIVEQGGVSSHQADGEPLEEPADGGGLLLPSVPCQGTAMSVKKCIQ